MILGVVPVSAIALFVISVAAAVVPTVITHNSPLCKTSSGLSPLKSIVFVVPDVVEILIAALSSTVILGFDTVRGEKKTVALPRLIVTYAWFVATTSFASIKVCAEFVRVNFVNIFQFNSPISTTF